MSSWGQFACVKCGWSLIIIVAAWLILGYEFAVFGEAYHYRKSNFNYNNPIQCNMSSAVEGQYKTSKMHIKYMTAKYIILCSGAAVTENDTVFYRNKKGDILFKVLQNEVEVAFPQLTPVSGPYYRWSDFKEWAASMMAAHPEIVAE